MAEMLFNGKRLEELKVVEIREELSRRGVSRKGIKSILIKRFEKVLLQERLDQEIEEDENDSKFEAEEYTSQEFDKEEPVEQEDPNLPEELETVKQEIRAGQRDETTRLDHEHLNTISQDPFNDDRETTEEDGMEVSFTSTEDRIADGESESMDRPVERLESVASIIEPSFPRDEELIYEGDVDNDEGDEPLSQVDMEVEEEEEKDELIVDFTAGELDLDPKPFERERTTASTTPSQPSLSSNDKSVDSKFGASKVDTEESSKERCNLWVSGLSQLVSASDLKTLFSPFGQVISAKVVARAKSAKTQRYGFVTLASPDQAEKSIQSLHDTELKGQVIAVELAKGSPFVSKRKKEDGLTTANKEPVKEATNDSNNMQSIRTSLGSDGKGNKSASKNDTSKGIGGSSGDKTATNKRIISVEKTDGRKELYTASGRRRRDEQRGGEIRRVRSRSPRLRSPRPRSRSPPRARRRGSPRGRIVSHRLSPVRRITGNPAPMHRRGMSPPIHRRMPGSPPPMHRRMGSPPPMHRRMPSPPPVHRRMSSPPPIRRGGGANDDVRRDLIRREMERRDMGREMERRDMGRDIRNRLGGRIAPPPTPPPVHQLEMRLEEQRRRMINERERERDVLRRQIEMEHSRKEQELVRQMQEMQQREERERSLLERQQREFIQLQRTMKERESHIEAKEREIREKEMRERQRLDALERQKEKESREKEKRYRDQLERDLKEREMMMHKEQEVMRMKLKEQERALLDKERQIRAEQEQMARAREDAKRRKEDEEKDKDRKDRRMGMYPKDDKEDKDRLGKRTIPDDGIFGRLGNQSSQDAGSSHSAIVKETQISPNVMYRRIESSGNKSGAINRGGGLNNPYSQNQSRSKALDSLTANYTTPRHSNNPVGYPQPSRYTSAQYPTQSVGYGANTTNDSNRFNSATAMQTNKLTNILNNPDLLNALTNVARTTTAIPQVPMGGGGSSSGYSGQMGGGYESNMGGGGATTGNRYYGGSGGLGNVSHGRPGGYPAPSMGMGRGGMGVPQPQFNKHMSKMPQESSDRYNRRAPPRPTPYSHFNKRM